LQDITERKKAEEMLKESESKLKALFELLPIGVSITDKERNILDANLALENILDLTRSDLLKETQKTRKYLRPNGTEMPAEEFPSARALKDEGSIHNSEIGVIKEDGSTIWTDVSAISLPFSDGQVVITTRDITERKRAEEVLKKAHGSLEERVKERTAELEESYKLLLENERRLSEAQKMAHIGIWDWDLATDEMYWSDEMCRIFGHNSQKFCSSYNEVLNSTHPDDRDYADNAVKIALKGKPFDIDHRIVLADGTDRVVHAQGEVVFDEKNSPIRMRGTVQDITERKKVEVALANAEEARKKEIHHRIKNNLQVISSLLDLQAEKFRDKEVLEALRESQNRVFSMSLIHEELYKGEGTDTLDFPSYLRKLAENLFQTYSLNSKNVCLRMYLEENAFFNMDIAVPLAIIVNELVSNSLKHAFTKEEKGEIKIQLCREEKNKDVYRSSFSLTVSDNGKGIPEDLELGSLESLGLQLVSTLVDQLDGEIELKRSKGTEFRITFNQQKDHKPR
jgi:two-component system, sensor histidine kinase PdtaS